MFDKKDSLLERIFEARVGNALEEALRNDIKYQKANAKTHKKVEKISEHKFSTEQWAVVDRALSAYNTRSVEYGRVAYMQGFRDAANLLWQVGNWKRESD